MKSQMARLREKYQQEVVPALRKEFGYTSVMAVPKITKVVVNMTGRDPLIVVEMKVPDEELVRRVQRRRVCKECGTNVSAFGAGPGLVQLCERCGGELVTRSDDSETIVRDRLKVYWRDTAPMIAYYGKRSTFRSIDGAQRPEQVRLGLVAAITEMAREAGVRVNPAGSGVKTGRGATGVSARKGVGA